jgi:hypothetical protein
VNEAVAQPDRQFELRNALAQLRLVVERPLGCFAEDLELPRSTAECTSALAR